MASGYCPSLLTHIRDIAEGNAPGSRLTPAGFTKMLFCCQNSSVSPLNQANENGHTRPLTVKYRPRPTLAVVGDTDNCEIDRMAGYLEWTVPGLMFRKTSFFVPDTDISRYCQDASRPAAIGGNRPTGFMQEHYEMFKEHVAVLFRAINLALVNTMATKFGNNVVNDSAIGRVININRNGADFALDDGIVALLTDLDENDLCEDPCFVGGGIFAAYDMARIMQCCNAAGVDPNRLGVPQLLKDRDTQTQWGANSFGVFAKGSVKLLTADKYVGPFAGEKGKSIFFNVPFPVNEFPCVDMAQCLRDLSVDVQMRYIDCPTEIDVAGTPQTVNRGWQVILSKNFGLWVQPTTGYATGDDLEGTNGTLLYYATNAAGSPGATTYVPA